MRIAMKLAVVALAALIGFVPVSFSQLISGNIVGSVVDATGAVVPAANVEAENVATGVRSTTTTDVNGLYRFNNVPAGEYNITIKKTGFADATLRNLTVELNKTTTANVVMQVAAVTTTVEVVEATSAIDTTTVQLQNTFHSDQIVDLPIIEQSGTSFGALNLALLGAGVASNGGIGQGQGPSIGGQRPMNNNFMVEGIDNNSKTVTGPLVYVPTEATAEFSLLQNQFSAEFGHSSGGQFNLIVKSGTNEIHGSAYEYFQNRNLNALDQSFARQGFTSPPRFDQNKVGVSIGGPIKKDKLFYFGNFEYAPLGKAFTAVPPEAPTAAGYSLLDQMQNTLPGFSKNNYAVMKQYLPPAPVPNGDTVKVNGVSIPLGVEPIAGSFYTNQYALVGSTDYSLSETDQLRGRFIYNKIDQLDNLAQLPAFWTTLPQRFYIATLTEYHNFSPTLTNEFRLGYNRYSQYYVVGPQKFPGLDVFPNIDLDDIGAAIGPDGSAPQYTVQNTYQMVENLGWVKGKHAFKFGFDGRNVISPQHFIQRERGEYEYSNLQDYLTDQVPDALAERNLGSTSYYGNQWATYLYAQDNYRIRRNVTLDLGLRWERTTVPIGMTYQTLNHVADVPGVLVFNKPATYNKAFAPKFGIAYSPGTSGNTSIRAGFGMAYDVIFDNVGSTAYPPQLSATVDAENFPNIFKAPFLANGAIFPGSVAVGGALSAADARAATSSYIPNQIPPYSINWNVGVQHVFHRDYTFEARYVGTKGVHLLVQNQMNKVARVTATQYLPTYLQAPSQATLDSLPLTLAQLQGLPVNSLAQYGFASTITWWPPIGNSIYHGLALQLNRRFAHGFQLIGAYTWSHNIDDSTATHFSTVLTPRREQDFFNLRADRATSALDRRHRLTVSWLWETPWMSHADSWFAKNLIGNWRFAGTYTAESPEYATVQSGVDSNLNGDSAGDRTIVNLNGVPGTGSGVTPLKNSSGATVAYLATNPNAQYIVAGPGARATAGRNTLATNGINNFDLSLAKRFTIREGKSLEFRGDFTNAFNHPQFTPGLISSIYYTTYNTGVRDYLIPGQGRFAKWNQVFSSNSRSGQLALRFVF